MLQDCSDKKHLDIINVKCQGLVLAAGIIARFHNSHLDIVSDKAIKS